MRRATDSGGCLVGIDELNLYGSTLSVEAADIAAARGVPCSEFRSLEAVRRSLAPSYEDTVTLAVNAAVPIVEASDSAMIELLIVATETGVDYGKPVSAYVHKYLSLAQACRNVELKHACYAGTAALQLATSWVRSVVQRYRAPRRAPAALVIMTDMARRLFGVESMLRSLGWPAERAPYAEVAEGAGAVAMLIRAEPGILAVETTSACAAREVYDITRPTATLECGDPVLSLGAYLDLLDAVVPDFRAQVGGVSLEAYFDHVVYHTPLVPLVRQAHRVFVEANRDDASGAEVAASFERMVAPSLGYCQEVGNIYGGSLYAALAGLIDRSPSLRTGGRVGLYSYGSGSCAELYSGVIAETARLKLGRRRIGEQLAARRNVSVDDYERVTIDTERGFTSPRFDPDPSLLPGHYEDAYRGKHRLVLEGVRDFYRSYTWS